MAYGSATSSITTWYFPLGLYTSENELFCKKDMHLLRYPSFNHTYLRWAFWMFSSQVKNTEESKSQKGKILSINLEQTALQHVQIIE